MATLDFTPLFRSSVGFDRLPDLLSDAVGRSESTYPPYNIETCGDDQYRIVLALAGFGKDDVEIVVEHNRLFVRGHKREPDGRTYLHRGIATRSFERHFDLADPRGGHRRHHGRGAAGHRSQARDPGGPEAAAHSDQRRRLRLARAQGQRPAEPTNAITASGPTRRAPREPQLATPKRASQGSESRRRRLCAPRSEHADEVRSQLRERGRARAIRYCWSCWY